MSSGQESLPHVSLNRGQWVRLVVVGLLVFFAIGRVVPDLVRVFYPLGIFGYVTDSNGIVVHAPVAPPKGSDVMLPGDRIRIDRVKPFDRKPGLVGLGYSYDNRVRYLPIERHGRERTLRLVARDETLSNRIQTVLRILLFVVVSCFGAILFIMAPSVATGAIFIYTLGGEFPTTYGDLAIPNPWRQIPELLAYGLGGAARPALLIFALCLIYESPRVQNALAVGGGIFAVLLGSLHAFGFWRLIYAGKLAQAYDDAYVHISSAITVGTILAFVLAFGFARDREERRRIGWIVATFALASAARLASDELYPALIPPWFNGLLLTATALPILVVWVAVVRNRVFNVDFVVSRAIVYVALTAGALGAISIVEEIGTYIFINNSDLAYGVLIVLATAVGALTGKLRVPIEKFVDRFIFRERRTQRKALEFIAGYILDAEAIDDVYRALLEDASHALQLSFAGVFERDSDGDYRLAQEFAWPSDYVVRLTASDDLIAAIRRSRGTLSSGKDTRLIGRAFPGQRLTFAAPLFLDRSVSAIVVYGRNVSGLDLDPDERELLVRVVAHASIALSAIELARFRALAAPQAVSPV